MGRRRAGRTVGCFAIAFLAFSSVAGAGIRPGQRAADFNLDSRSGQRVSLAKLRGKVVLVDFWASWCEPCKRELPLLGASERLRDKGIEVIAINVDKDRKNAESFLRMHPVKVTVLWNPDGSVADQYEPPKMPSSYVIDKKGLVRYVNSGFEPGDEKKFEKQLVELAAP